MWKYKTEKCIYPAYWWRNRELDAKNQAIDCKNCNCWLTNPIRKAMTPEQKKDSPLFNDDTPVVGNCRLLTSMLEELVKFDYDNDVKHVVITFNQALELAKNNIFARQLTKKIMDFKKVILKKMNVHSLNYCLEIDFINIDELKKYTS